MGVIEKRKNGNGFNYRVKIRKKGINLFKTFQTEEDANLYVYYKERLIDNMQIFEVPLKDRITLKQIIELKISSLDQNKKKAIQEFDLAYKIISKFIEKKPFLHQISLQDWINICKSLLKEDAFRGARTEHGKKKMSLGTIRRYFANISSAISYAQTLGIEIDNLPLKVIQTHINPNVNILE